MNNSDNFVFATRTLDSGITVEVLQDTDPMNPRRDWDNESLMVCFHKRYDLGDSNTGYNERDFDDWHQVYEQLRIDGYQTILALYLYDHSGISISAKSFLGRAHHAEWDSGQVGFIASKELGHDTYLMDEVSAYDSYLQGNVYAYRIYEDKTCESCNHTSQEVYAYTGGYDTPDEALSAGIYEANYVKVGA